MTRPRLVLATPAPPGSRHGNRTTAARWASILRDLGFRVAVSQTWDGSPCDGLIALHARKSGDSIHRFAKAHPDRPLVVALTGTDLYLDLNRSAVARRSLEIADRLVVLHPGALRDLPKELHAKIRVILQSLDPRSLLRGGVSSEMQQGIAWSDRSHRLWKRAERSYSSTFDVCVLAHLRKVKDPLLPARAARLLPESSRVRILQIGEVVEQSFESSLRRELARNPRLRWLGNLPRSTALERLRRSRLLVNSSIAEGGANALSEAIVLGVPVLASRVPGNLGLLGEDYPGYFPCRDAQALANLLERCELDSRFLDRLSRRVTQIAPRFRPEHEHHAWKRLLRELGLASRSTEQPAK